MSWHGMAWHGMACHGIAQHSIACLKSQPVSTCLLSTNCIRSVPSPILGQVLLGPSLAAVLRACVQSHSRMHHVTQPPRRGHICSPPGYICSQGAGHQAPPGRHPLLLQSLQHRQRSLHVRLRFGLVLRWRFRLTIRATTPSLLQKAGGEGGQQLVSKNIVSQ